MSRAGLWLMLAMAGSPPSNAGPAAAPPVHVVAGEVSICPDGFADCNLTTVDNKLCVFLAELLDPAADEYRDRYNCGDGTDGVYACVNVLGRRQGDARAGTDYTYPYLVELADAYERQLDKCLPGWQKKGLIAAAGQSILYTYDRREVALSIVPFERGGVRYDRLTLRIHDPVPGPAQSTLSK